MDIWIGLSSGYIDMDEIYLLLLQALTDGSSLFSIVIYPRLVTIFSPTSRLCFPLRSTERQRRFDEARRRGNFENSVFCSPSNPLHLTSPLRSFAKVIQLRRGLQKPLGTSPGASKLNRFSPFWFEPRWPVCNAGIKNSGNNNNKLVKFEPFRAAFGFLYQSGCVLVNQGCGMVCWSKTFHVLLKSTERLGGSSANQFHLTSFRSTVERNEIWLSWQQ